MREYKLADPNNRLIVDLTDYADLIIDTVHSEAPDVSVSVFKDRYVLNKKIPRGQVICIGKKLASSILGHYCQQRPILFVGYNPRVSHSKGGDKSHGSTTSANTKSGGRPKKTITR